MTGTEELTKNVSQVASALQAESGAVLAQTILRAVILLVVCLIAMKVIMHLMNRAINRLNVERSLHTFLRSSLRILLWFITILIVASSLGIDATSLIAVLSVVGLAVSLAVQNILANLAGGIMVLISKPFKVGDFVEAGGISGTVADVGMVYTKIRTIDNKIIFVPNGQISGEKISNYTDQERRRVDLIFSASYDAPVEQVKAAILETVRKHPMVLHEPEPFVRVSAYQDSAIDYALRAWCATGDYWDVYYDMLEQVKASFDQHGIEMTYNHLNVHMMKD
ncbi:MAG: mechanosensitive ion channel family protein [Intestinimonas sp.]|jgi:small conductance mechanosensitive channel|nr:mechanosensitive ion channel family protein [Intestinimonas sp.]